MKCQTCVRARLRHLTWPINLGLIGLCHNKTEIQIQMQPRYTTSDIDVHSLLILPRFFCIFCWKVLMVLVVPRNLSYLPTDKWSICAEVWRNLEDRGLPFSWPSYCPDLADGSYMFAPWPFDLICVNFVSYNWSVYLFAQWLNGWKSQVCFSFLNVAVCLSCPLFLRVCLLWDKVVEIKSPGL